MTCPKCGSKSYVVTRVRGVTTLLGAGTGGYMAAATAGAKAGAVVGHMLCPGPGTVIGGILGILVGAAGGAVAGHTVCRLIDEAVFRHFKCEMCGHTWRA